MPALNDEFRDAIACDLDDMELYIRQIRTSLKNNREDEVVHILWGVNHLNDLTQSMYRALDSHYPDQAEAANQSFPVLNQKQDDADAPKM